jgi:hypothetical protein
VVGIVPRPVHGVVDPFDKTQVVAAEERRDAVGEEDVKEPKTQFKEQWERCWMDDGDGGSELDGDGNGIGGKRGCRVG